jgi:ABC-2 type transport system ATP-binding protein
MHAVEIENVSKSFGPVRAVADLSLAVPKGSIYGFIGPNGSGKTTTLRMILDIFRPDIGTIRVLGAPLAGPQTDRVGYLPEERGLYRRMKVRDLIQFYGGLKSGRNLRAETDHWLERFGLIDCANRKIEALSKGMSQKVQFIAAVVFGPELLILDEPFSGLDPVNAEVIRTAVLDLRHAGATVILSTHDMRVAETLCDFICMIFQGRKVLDGTLAAIQDRHGCDTVRIRTEDGVRVLDDLEAVGVESVKDLGQIQELHLRRGTDPQAVLATLVARTRIRLFEIARPSLHDIFVRIARPEPAAASDPSHEPDLGS